MASIKAATRYNNNSLTSSTRSDPSSSTEFSSSRDTSRAITKKASTPTTNTINFSSMVKKLVDNNKKARNFSKDAKLILPDFLAEDLKKTGKKSSGLGGLHKKLFKGSGAKKGEESSTKKALMMGDDNSAKKALTEVKGNTRTLGMVLRSERELLRLNKERDEQIAELKSLLEDKNKEVEKLKDLCLKQREEIKSLKNAILFPDVMNTQLQELLETQGSELKQAKQLIPSLQKQVSSLTGQLQCLAEDLAEVKAEKHSARKWRDNYFNSPRTPSFDQEEASNSLNMPSSIEQFDQEFSSGDYTTTPGSPDDMFLQDLNPCLTPYSKMSSKEFQVYGSPDNDDGLSRHSRQINEGAGFNRGDKKVSKSSDCCQCSNEGKSSVYVARRSEESKHTYGRKMHHKLF